MLVLQASLGGLVYRVVVQGEVLLACFLYARVEGMYLSYMMGWKWIKLDKKLNDSY